MTSKGPTKRPLQPPLHVRVLQNTKVCQLVLSGPTVWSGIQTRLLGVLNTLEGYNLSPPPRIFGTPGANRKVQCIVYGGALISHRVIYGENVEEGVTPIGFWSGLAPRPSSEIRKGGGTGEWRTTSCHGQISLHTFSLMTMHTNYTHHTHAHAHAHTHTHAHTRTHTTCTTESA